MLLGTCEVSPVFKGNWPQYYSGGHYPCAHSKHSLFEDDCQGQWVHSYLTLSQFLLKCRTFRRNKYVCAWQIREMSASQLVAVPLGWINLVKKAPLTRAQALCDLDETETYSVLRAVFVMCYCCMQMDLLLIYTHI